MKFRLCVIAIVISTIIFSGIGFSAVCAQAKSGIKPGENIRIGVIGPMALRTGAHMMITAQMGIDAYNAAGGIEINGSKHKIELIKIDSNEFANVADAAAGAERAISKDKVHFLIGGVVDEAVSVIQEIAADNEIVFISTSYTVSENHIKHLRKDYDRYKYCFTTASAAATALATAHIGIIETIANAVKAAGVEKPKVAQLVAKSRPGDLILGLTTRVFTAKGMEIVGDWRPSNQATDLRAETAAIKSSKPNIIYTLFSGSAGLVFGKQVKELKIPAIVGGSPASSLFPGQGIEYSVTMMGPQSIAEKISENNVSFYTEFLKRSNNELCVINAYDAAAFLLKAVEKTKSLKADSIIKTLETEHWSAIAGDMKFDPKYHKTKFLNNFRPVYGVQKLPGGKQAIVWPTEKTAIKAAPVEIPAWMIESWKKM